MKLGISYLVFDGEELLEFAIKSIRSQVDFISVVYQNLSYFGNRSNPEETLSKIKEIDSLVLYEPNLSLHFKENELNIRNFGLSLSKSADCTHHISSDVDEFYDPDQLKYAKTVVENNFDCSIVFQEYYYKEPTYLVRPCQKYPITFIHPISSQYTMETKFPYSIEITRQLSPNANIKVFDMNEITMHHMSYVRKDIKKKLDNNSNGLFYQKNKFIDNFNKYQLGDKLKIAPDFLYRRTILVENKFGIKV